MRHFVEDVMVPISMAFLFLAAIGASIFCIGAWVTKHECANLAEVAKRKTDWRFIGGCYVEHEGEMLPYDRWKLLDVRVTTRR